jgi:oxygen-dependent protoporphyrinogen oxidase
MKSIAIIGAGITGLTAAFYLKRKGIPVTVYEASGRVGGVIQSLRQDGYPPQMGRFEGASVEFPSGESAWNVTVLGIPSKDVRLTTT